MESLNLNSNFKISKEEKEESTSSDDIQTKTNYEHLKIKEFSIEKDAMEERIISFLERNGLERRNSIETSRFSWQKKRIAHSNQIKKVAINFKKMNLSCDLYKRRKTDIPQN